MTRFADIVGSANIKDTLSDAAANGAVRAVLRSGPAGRQVQLLGLQEWDGGAPACLKGTGYRYERAKGGGGPVVYDGSRYGLQWTRTKLLARGGFVGHLPGRRSQLGDSRAAVYCFADDLSDRDTVLVVAHLTAEVQVGPGYRGDTRHKLRVARHKLERAHLQALVRWHRARRREVYVCTDTNYDSMPLPPLLSCWQGHPRDEAKGTLGHRAVDYVYGPGRSADVRTVPTASDHDAVVATYQRSE